MSTASPLDFECGTCDAAPGSPCRRPRGHAALRPGGFHAGRRALAGYTDGPIHPRHFIKPGEYVHGCGEPITIDSTGRVRARRVIQVGWDENPCPRCNRRVWIEDLGPQIPLPAPCHSRLFSRRRRDEPP